MGARYVSRSSHMPGAVQVASCVVCTASDAEAAGFTTDQEGVCITATGLTTATNATGTYPMFYVPFGTIVTNMRVNKVTAASVGNMTIGDSDVDGFAEAHGLLSTVAGVWDMHLSTGAEAYMKGRYYTDTTDTYDTDDMAVINATVASAALEAGYFEVYLEYFNRYEVKMPQ